MVVLGRWAISYGRGTPVFQARDGRQNGEAFVEFADEIHALEGIKKDRETIGSRYQTGRAFIMY